MKMNPYTFNLKALIVLLIFLAGCECKNKIQLTGQVLSVTNKPISDAEVVINGETAQSGKEGRFEIALKEDTVNQFLVTIRKKGYGLYSKKIFSRFKDLKCYLTQGVVVEFDPTKDLILRDTLISSNSFQPPLLALDTAKLFKVIPRVYDSSGKLIDFGLPAEINDIFDYIQQPIPSQQGVTLFIPANTLVDAQGNRPTGLLRASLSTVDFFNPDGMPGNFTVRSRDGDSYMESMGACTIEIFDEKGKYQLKKDAKSKLIVPVYSIRQAVNDSLPQTVDVLYYDEKDGVWDKEGTARLNRKLNAYETELAHFSVVNMDIIKSGPSACLKFRQMTNTTAHLQQYNAEVIVPVGPSNALYRENKILISENAAAVTNPQNSGCVSYNLGSGKFTRLHPVVRLPTQSYIVFVFSDPSVVPNKPIDIAVIKTTSQTIPDPLTFINTNCAVTDEGSCAGGGDPNTDENAGSNNACWQTECSFVPFRNPNPPASFEVIAYKNNNAAGKVTIKWVSTIASVDHFRVARLQPALNECFSDNTPPNACVTDCSVANATCNCNAEDGASVTSVPFTATKDVYELELDYGAGSSYVVEALNSASTILQRDCAKVD